MSSRPAPETRSRKSKASRYPRRLPLSWPYRMIFTRSPKLVRPTTMFIVSIISFPHSRLECANESPLPVTKIHACMQSLGTKRREYIYQGKSGTNAEYSLGVSSTNVLHIRLFCGYPCNNRTRTGKSLQWQGTDESKRIYEPRMKQE